MSNKISFPEEYHERALAEKYKDIFNAIEQIKDLDKMTISELEVHILEKFGWKLVDFFTNSRTKNTVGIYTKEIK